MFHKVSYLGEYCLISKYFIKLNDKRNNGQGSPRLYL